MYIQKNSMMPLANPSYPLPLPPTLLFLMVGGEAIRNRRVPTPCTSGDGALVFSKTHPLFVQNFKLLPRLSDACNDHSGVV